MAAPPASGPPAFIATRFIAVVPSDTVPISMGGLYVGVGGDVALKDAHGNPAVVFKAVLAGTILPLAPGFVMATGTTATSLIGLS